MALFPLISSAFSFLDSCALVCTQRVVSIVESSLTAVCQELGWTTSGRVLQAGAEEEAQEGFEGLQEERGREGESEEDNRGEAQDLMEEGEEVRE